jgi:hypothetical protein
MTKLNRADLDGWPDQAVGPVRLADGLGWASAALGGSMLLMRRRFLQAIGVRPDGPAAAITAGVGVREFAATGTILGLRHRRVGAWSRVLGDTMDLALLGAAWRSRRVQTPRLLGAMAFVAAILAVDLLVALRLGQAEGARVEDGSTSHGRGATPARRGGPGHVRTAITVQGSEEELRRALHEFAWSAFDPVTLEQRGEIRFAAAPGGRGVEIHLDHDASVLGGGVGAIALKLAGRSPDQKINDDLRRFKARVETGVEVRSDKTPEGFSARRQILQRPAQPAGMSS